MVPASRPGHTRLRTGRPLVTVIALIAVLAGGTVAYAAVTGALYGRSGRVATLGVYATDYVLTNTSCPVDIAFDGTNMWTVNQGLNCQGPGTVSKITPTGTVTTYALPLVSPPTTWPMAIAFDGTNMWVASNNSSPIGGLPVGSVHKVTPTGAMTSYVLPNNGTTPSWSPTDIVFDGANMWVASTSYAYVARVTPAGVITSHLVMANGGPPRRLAFDGYYLYAGTNSQVVRFAPTTDPIVTPALVQNVADPVNALAYDGSNVWSAGYSALGTISVSKLAADSTAVTTYALTYPRGPHALALDVPGYTPAANGPIDPAVYLWIANRGANSVSRLDVATGAIVGTYPVGAGPTALAFDGMNLWIAHMFAGTVGRMRVR